MKVQQLTDTQREALKIQYFIENIDPEPSWGELAAIDIFVTDAQLCEAYGDTVFTEDDFLC